MKYFVIEGTLKEATTIDESTMSAHIAYYQEAFEEGRVLSSEIKNDVSGGLTTIKSKSIDEVNAFLSADPLSVSGNQEYRVVEFQPQFIHPTSSEWFKG